MDRVNFTKNKHERGHSCLESLVYWDTSPCRNFYVNKLYEPIIVLASSSLDLRLCLEGALSDQAGFAGIAFHLHVATAGQPPEFVSGPFADSTSLIVLDPEGSPIPISEMIRKWHESIPDSPLLLLAETHDAEQASAWLRAGARGLLSPQAPAEVMRKAITVLIRGELWLPRGLMAKVLTGMLKPKAVPRKPALQSGFELLTARETEVAEAAIAGLSNREIAERFAIGESTVKTHLHHAFEKLNLVRRSQLLKRAPSAGS